MDGIGSAELPIVPFSPSFVPHPAWFNMCYDDYLGYRFCPTDTHFDTEVLKSLCIENAESCKGITPQKGTYGRGTNNAREILGEYYHSESLRMKKRSIAMENERLYHTSARMVSATKSTIQVLELETLPDAYNYRYDVQEEGFADSDDNCELQCQKHAMLQFDGSNDTQEWYHQVQARTVYEENAAGVFSGHVCDTEESCRKQCATQDDCKGYSTIFSHEALARNSSTLVASCYVKEGLVLCRGPNTYAQLGRGLCPRTKQSTNRL